MLFEVASLSISFFTVNNTVTPQQLLNTILGLLYLTEPRSLSDYPFFDQPFYHEATLVSRLVPLEGLDEQFVHHARLRRFAYIPHITFETHIV